MKEIYLSKKLSLPLESLSLRWVEYGNSGAGKTALGRVIFEEADNAGVPTGVIDLKGDWWGLKSSKSGESAGRQVIIFGGDHADVPLNENAGAEVADIVVELRHNFILDFEAFSKNKQLKFIAAFMERFYDKNREPFNLLCDEADRYIQQKPYANDVLAGLCNGASQDIAKRGRKHGIFSKFITQRNADISKSVTELCDLAIIFRTSGPNDQKAVLDWLYAKGNLIAEAQIEEVRQNMAGLVNGEGYICSAHPDIRVFERVKFRWPETFDSSATPKIGEQLAQPKRLAKVDMDALGERIKKTIDEAKKSNPAHLKAEVARLKKELDNRPLESEMPAPIPVPVLSKNDIKMIDSAVDLVTDATVTVEKYANSVLHEVAQLRKFIGDLKTSVDKASPLSTPRKTYCPPSTPRNITAEIKKMIETPRSKMWHTQTFPKGMGENTRTEMNGSLPIGEEKILSACIQFPAGVKRNQLTVLTGYKKSSRDAYIARLTGKELVEANGQLVKATGLGYERLPNAQPLPTGEELQKYWLARLPEGERKIFEVLLQQYPDAVPRDVLSELTGYKKSSRDAYLSRMAAKMITDEPERGMVRAAEQLFQ